MSYNLLNTSEKNVLTEIGIYWPFDRQNHHSKKILTAGIMGGCRALSNFVILAQSSLN